MTNVQATWVVYCFYFLFSPGPVFIISVVYAPSKFLPHCRLFYSNLRSYLHLLPSTTIIATRCLLTYLTWFGSTQFSRSLDCYPFPFSHSSFMTEYNALAPLTARISIIPFKCTFLTCKAFSGKTLGYLWSSSSLFVSALPARILLYCIYPFLWRFSQPEPFRSAPTTAIDTVLEYTRQSDYK